MRYDPERHHRRSIRLKGYDYSRTGTYFVTICTWQRECLLGTVHDGVVQLSEAGVVVQQCWDDLPRRFPGLTLDAFVAMPNHVHGILRIVRKEPPHDDCVALGGVIRAFKSLAGVSINRVMGRSERRAWQRNYYEHIIWDEEALRCIRAYIRTNPQRWESDEDNPKNAYDWVDAPK